MGEWARTACSLYVSGDFLCYERLEDGLADGHGLDIAIDGGAWSYRDTSYEVDHPLVGVFGGDA